MKKIKAWRKAHPKMKWVPRVIVILVIIWACGFFYFGGYKFESANTEEFAKYAQEVENLEIPSNIKVVALGEATHGNVEFQELKLDVLKVLVEKYGVRSLCLEADYSACQSANDYIHGGKGTALEAAKATGFQIYHTQQMADLMDYMREFNKTAVAGDDIVLYGIDMQSMDKELADNATAQEAEHYAACEEQHQQLAEIYNENNMWGENGYNAVRDSYMKDNLMWCLEQEQARGHERIFLTAHNGHIAKYKDTTDLGSLLSKALGDDYYTIGTEFYKASVTLRSGSKFKAHTFYSHDPLAKAAKDCGYERCLLDFAKVPADSPLRDDIDNYSKMGNLGERYSILNRFLPRTYQQFSCPGQLYNSVIYVTEAHPTELID